MIKHLFFLFCFIQCTALVAQCECSELVLAIEANDAEKVASCLALGTDPNCTFLEFEKDSVVPIGKPENIFKLVWQWESRPLVVAIRTNNIQLVNQLVAAGASVQVGSRCIKDTLTGVSAMRLATPLDLAEELSDQNIFFFLQSQGAVDATAQYNRGERFARLVISHAKTHPDSLLALEQMIQTHGESIEFGGIYRRHDVLGAAFSRNIVPAYTYLVDVKKVELQKGKYHYYVRKLYRVNRSDFHEYYPFERMIYGDDVTVEAVQFFTDRALVSDSVLQESVVENHTLNKNLRKYYKKHLYLKQRHVSKRKEKCIRRRMEKLRLKVLQNK